MSYAVLLYFFEVTNLRNYHKFIKHDGNSVVQGLFHSFGLWTIYTQQKKRSDYFGTLFAILAMTYLSSKRIASIFGAEGLNFCVRDGNRCDPFASITRNI